MAKRSTLPLPDRVHALTFGSELTIYTAEAHHINVLLAKYCASVCCSHHLTAELTGVAADVTGISIAYLVKSTIRIALFISIAEVLYGKVVLRGEVGVLIVGVVDYLIADEFPFF